MDVLERLEDMSIQPVQKIERSDNLARLVKSAQPVQEHWSVIGIARKTISHQIDVFFRRVLEWEILSAQLTYQFRAKCSQGIRLLFENAVTPAVSRACHANRVFLYTPRALEDNFAASYDWRRSNENLRLGGLHVGP